MPTFKARYVTDCAACHKPIQIGQAMSWNPRGDTKKKHWNCEDPDAMPEFLANKPESGPTNPTPTVQPTDTSNPLTAAIVAAVQPYIKTQLDADQVRSIVAEELSNLPEPKSNVLTVEVKRPDQTVHSINGAHKQIPTLLKLINRRKNTYLYGAAGGGKTTAASHVAEALGLNLYTISLNIQSTPSLITGYKDAQGTYQPTDFRKWYENGGVFLADEYDNASGNLQTTLNTGLDNGHMSFPDGRITRHPDAVFIAAGNTVGLGANRTYSSRQVMDGAARERFVYLGWEYDTDLEMEKAKAINPKNGELWATWIQLVRLSVSTLKIELIVSPRATFNGAELLLDGFTVDQVADMVLFKGIDSDTRAKILASNPLPKVGA